ncbi:hypothetical protein [Sulfitobacter sp. 1A15299]|uniref:hypothetical protein n=1 Tax=Sulfitobacter TaxID=60136 RepID=UPI0037473481
MSKDQRDFRISRHLRRWFWFGIGVLALLWVLAAFEVVDYLSDADQAAEALR